MFYIDKRTNKITLTRGDSAEIAVSVVDANGEDRGIFADDVLTLTVRQKASSPVASITKTAIDGVFVLEPADTANLPSGTYVYDVELKSFTGKTYTIIPKSSFALEEDITR